MVNSKLVYLYLTMDRTEFLSIDKTVTCNREKQSICINHLLVESKYFKTDSVKLLWDLSLEYIHII